MKSNHEYIFRIFSVQAIIFSLFFLINIRVYSQYINTTFERLTPGDGLSQSTVNFIIQDKKGFMWFGTNDGLNKYDGCTFKIYQNIVGDKTSISHNEIRNLFEDNEGNIWVVTRGSGGLNKFNSKTETFTRFKPVPGDSTSISSDVITSVMQDRSGKIWICANNAVNLVVNKRIGNETITSFQRFYNTSNSSRFTRIYENKDGRLLLFAEDLYYFDKNNYKIIKTNTGLAPPGTNFLSIYSISEDRFGNLWLGTNTMGIIKLDYNEKTKSYKKSELNNKINITPNKKNILLIDHKDRIWIGTETKGLFLYHEKNGRLINFINDKIDLNSISDNTINSLYIDRSGILWIGTFSQGLCKYNLFKKQFHHFKPVPGKDNSLSGNVVRAIHGRNPGELLVGLEEEEGINRVTFKEEGEYSIVHYKFDSKNEIVTNSNSVLSLHQRRNGEVWVGTASNSITKIFFDQPGFKKVPYIEMIPHTGWVFSIYEDSQEIVWVGSWGGGLARYDKTGTCTYFQYDPQNPKSLPDNVVWTITEDNAGNIWVGTRRKGLCILPKREKNKSNPEFLNYRHNEEDPYSLSNNLVNTIHKDHTGTIWVGTAVGLNKVINDRDDFNDITDNKKLKFISYHIKDGLPSEGIVSLLDDNSGNIWLGTSRGLSKFVVSKDTFINYNQNDGLGGIYFWTNSHYKDSSGKMYFGGSNGFIAFDPDSINPNHFIPEVVFTDIRISNKSVKIGEKINGDIVLSRSINNLSEISLSHKNNVFTIEFAALHYAQPGENRYAYIMEGFDDNWNFIKNKRDVTFTNLNPGEYILRVKASNRDGIWNKEGTSLKVIILPPWWNTWWFRVILVLVVLYSVIRIIKHRTHQLKRQKIQLTQMVKEQTSQLRETNNVLKEKQEEIYMQNEELQSQKESLQEANRTLGEKNQEIEKQKNEIDQHRNHLETLVKEQTADLIAAMKKVEESDRLKSAFLSNMSHEIRTPMNAIIGFSSLLDEPDCSDKEREIYRSYIRKNSEGLLVLINDILEMSKIQSNQLIINNWSVDVIEIMKELLASFQLQAKPKGIELIFDAGIYRNSLICSTDPIRLKQILSNLISNALKFTEHGYVKFGITNQNKGFLTFYVKDSGIGIPKEVGNSIFERFQKVESKKRKFYEGVGLGLSICYNLINAMGGNIWYESNVGQGTIFYFTIPYGNREDISLKEIKKIEKQEIPNLEDKHILIVEDDETNYKLLEFYLAKTNANISWAKNGQEALEHYKNNNFDLILMDLKLPVMDGIETTRLIRKIYPDQLIIAQTAFAYKEEKAEFMRCNFNGYIEKPIIRDRLMKIINEVI